MEILPKLYGNMFASLGEIFEAVLPVICKYSEGKLGKVYIAAKKCTTSAAKKCTT
jgi:hypothetical protein